MPADVEMVNGMASIRPPAAGKEETSVREPAYSIHETTRRYFESHIADIVLITHPERPEQERIEVKQNNQKAGETHARMGTEVVGRLQLIARTMATKKSAKLPVIKELLKRVDRAVLVLTHQDLFPYLDRFLDHAS